MFYVSWSYSGGRYIRCFPSPEERARFIRVYLSPRWNLRTWDHPQN